MVLLKERRRLIFNLICTLLIVALAIYIYSAPYTSTPALKAYVLLDNSIKQSNNTINIESEELYEAVKFAQTIKGRGETVKPWREELDIIVKESNEMTKYIEAVKTEIVNFSNEYSKTAVSKKSQAYPDKIDNIDAATYLMINKKKGEELQERIIKFRELLLAHVPVNEAEVLEKKIPLQIRSNDNAKDNNWSKYNFQYMPVVAVLALLSNMQNDIRSSEHIIIEYLSQMAMRGGCYMGDSIAAVAIPETCYLQKGDKVRAGIGIAAFKRNTRINFSISDGGGTYKDNLNGVVSWQAAVSGIGWQTVKGTISYRSLEEEKMALPWSFKYWAGATGASLRLDKMNIAYVGVDNPFTITVEGYSINDIILKPAHGGIIISEEGGRYVLRVTKPDKHFKIDIMAKPKEKNGALIKISSIQLRAMLLPNPKPTILDGRNSGNILSRDFRNAVRPKAELNDCVVEGEFRITKFKFSMVSQNGVCIPEITVSGKTTSTKFADNAKVEEMVKTAKAGDRIYISNIHATGPDNKDRNIGCLNFILH